MKNILITGATGMIGGIVLDFCLQSNEVAKVTSIGRKATGKSHSKLKEIIHEDFTDFSQHKDAFKEIDIAYFCLGVYTGAVSREKFREITVDYTKVFADILKAESNEAVFCFLSGQGADETEKSKMMFAKDKGIAENYLKQKGFKGLHIFRPAYIYPVTPRKEPNLAYQVFRYLYPLVNALTPNSAVTSEHLAKAIFKIGIQGSQKVIFENKDIRDIEVYNNKK